MKTHKQFPNYFNHHDPFSFSRLFSDIADREDLIYSLVLMFILSLFLPGFNPAFPFFFQRPFSGHQQFSFNYGCQQLYILTMLCCRWCNVAGIALVQYLSSFVLSHLFWITWGLYITQKYISESWSVEYEPRLCLGLDPFLHATIAFFFFFLSLLTFLYRMMENMPSLLTAVSRNSRDPSSVFHPSDVFVLTTCFFFLS